MSNLKTETIEVTHFSNNLIQLKNLLGNETKISNEKIQEVAKMIDLLTNIVGSYDRQIKSISDGSYKTKKGDEMYNLRRVVSMDDKMSLIALLTKF